MCITHVVNKNTHTISTENSEGSDHLGGTRSKWKNLIKIDVLELECKSVKCVNLAHDMVNWRASVNTVMNLWVPQEKDSSLKK